MLPSTGYFKTINCPFYENGSCERPYCHFKHSRREDVANTAGVAGVVEAQAMGQSEETKTNAASSNSERLKQLVTEAVKKVLADQEVTDTEKFSNTIVSQVVEGLKPTLQSTSASLENTTNIIGKHVSLPTPIVKSVPCVYNPTPIAELKKRHIPVVSYMPTRESKVSAKRKSSPDRIRPWLSIAQESSVSQPTEITYKPTTIVNTTEQECRESYVPTYKSELSLLNSYDDSNSNDYVPKSKEAYYPKSKKRREEYVPKMVKAPLKNVQHIDETVLDQFEPEFDMIDEILTTAHTGQSIQPTENSEEYNMDVEPKFSDDELMEDASKMPDADTNELIGKDGSENEKEEENKCLKTDAEDKQGSNEDEEKEKSEQRDESCEESQKQKVKAVNREAEKDKKEHRSTSRSHSADKRSHNHSDKSKKESCRHKSSSSDRRHSSSSSSKDKDKKKSSHSSKSSSNKNKEHSNSHKRKDSHSEKERHKSKNDKHKSSSRSSKSEKHSSSRKDHEKKHQSRSDHRSNSSSKKSRKHKESSSERYSSEHEEKSNSSVASLDSFIDNGLLETSDSDHDVQEECLKIFQEYEVTDHPKPVSIKETTKQEPEETEEVGKKRVAHPSAATSVCKHVGPDKPPIKHPDPQQNLYKRWRLMREAAAEKAAERAAAAKDIVKPTATSQSSGSKPEMAVTSSNSDVQINGNGRVRIAHVPYAMSLAIQKKKVTETVNKSLDNNKSIDNRTAAQTSKKGRVAHIPQMVPQLIRPEPLQIGNQKFPLNVRQYYVNMMHDICIQIYTSGDDAAQRAVREEHACHERCKALPVYKNSCMLAVHRLRKEIEQSELSNGPTASASGIMSHEAVLAGKSRGSWSVMKTRKSVVDLKGAALYIMLKKWILTEQQLRDNGFPRPHPDGPKGRAKMYVTNSRNQNALTKVPNERVCSRCNSTYMVNKQGLPVEQQNCIYHWGRKFSVRGESKYSCCQQYGSATGCCDAKTHVWDYTDYENLRGYVKTLPKNIPPEDQGVFALDCEMCYTTHGLELTRVTVVNEDCNVVYETLVKPQNPIIDYNTRFSGITENDMENVTTTLLDVQATLLTTFSDKTILIGHSLESDFKALRLLHDTIVDTSVMFPHRNGYPQKRALKNLCSEYLRKLIQNDVGGHDSKEDAVACMELVRWKVKEEAKLQ